MSDPSLRPGIVRAIEQQCDNMAVGTQDRQFLRDDNQEEPLYRELLRLNFEQFVKVTLPAYGFNVVKRPRDDGHTTRVPTPPKTRK